jgi:colicin import membrane protein
MTEIKTQDTVAYDASAAIVLANKAQQALTSASDFVIDSHTMFELASDDLMQVKSLQKEVEAKRTSITGPLNQAVKAVNDLFRSPKDYLDKAEATLKRAMVTWTTEQERLAAIARAEAEAAARAERERLAKIEREQAEAARKAQEEAQSAAAAGDQAAADKAMAEAQAAQEQAAMAAMTANVVTITPQVEAPAKVSGISGRVTYSAEVTNLMELVKAVAAGTAPLEALQADAKFLGAQARAFKKAGQLYPGVMAVAERSIAARAA